MAKTKGKPKPKRKPKRVKAGTNKQAYAERKRVFAAAYIINGGNKYQAALTAGYKPGEGAEKAGTRLSADVGVITAIAEATAKAAAKAGLTVDRTLLETARVAYSDPRRFYDDKGRLIPIARMDAETAASIASVEFHELTGNIKRLRTWDKNAALTSAMKYHGLYERDNEQNKPVVAAVSVTMDWPAIKAKLMQSTIKPA